MSIYRFYDCSGNLLDETSDEKRVESLKEIPWITYTVEKKDQN